METALELVHPGGVVTLLGLSTDPAKITPAGVDGIRPWVSAGHSGCLSQESPGFIRGEVSI